MRSYVYQLQTIPQSCPGCAERGIQPDWWFKLDGSVICGNCHGGRRGRVRIKDSTTPPVHTGTDRPDPGQGDPPPADCTVRPPSIVTCITPSSPPADDLQGSIYPLEIRLGVILELERTRDTLIVRKLSADPLDSLRVTAELAELEVFIARELADLKAKFPEEFAEIKSLAPKYNSSVVPLFGERPEGMGE